MILPSTNVIQKTISSPAPSPSASALAIPEFPVAEWRPLKNVISLPSEKVDFINTVSTISDSKILTQITSIFKGSGNCDATLGVTKDFILLGPEIRLVPYSGLDAQDLRLSLLSRVPWKAESQTHKHGVLKLDMKVIKASWTTE